MNRIKKMSNHLSNKIAAGEVVEDAASVVKELVENSIDANCSEITIEISKAGKAYIKITDDGFGIHEDDINLIFESHATSKIHENDIDAIETFGFRGEALASIASISKVTMLSKRLDSQVGFKLELVQGDLFSHEKISTNCGTSILVEDLFYNVPARYKFIKNNASVQKKINKIVSNLAIANPNIKFTYIVDFKNIFNTSGQGDMLNAIYNIYGKDLIENLVNFNYSYNNIRLDGYVSNLNYYRGNKSMQSLFVNNRYVKNTLIGYTINEAYKKLIPIHNYPAYFINTTIDFKLVDVNIHPTKILVKINGEDLITEELRQELKNQLYKKNIIPAVPFKEAKDTKPINEQISVNDIVNIDDFKREKIKFFENQEFEFTEQIIEDNSAEYNSKYSIYENLNYIGQVFNTYLIFEKEESIYLLDQHAAHEKILYEEFMDKYNRNKIDSQILLSPVLLELAKEEVKDINENIDKYAKLGFDIEQFSENDIIIRGIPSIFNIGQAKLMILNIIDSFRKTTFNFSKLHETSIIQESCKSAIKANDAIDIIEVDTLINKLKMLKDPLTCPHGRPIIKVIGKKELEKMFSRI